MISKFSRLSCLLAVVLAKEGSKTVEGTAVALGVASDGNTKNIGYIGEVYTA